MIVNDLDYFIQYLRSLLPGTVEEKTSTQGTGTLDSSQTLSHIKQVKKGSTCLFGGWDYTLEQDKTNPVRGLYKITFPDTAKDYEVKYMVGTKIVYPDFPIKSVTFPRVSVIQNNTTYSQGGHGTWSSTADFKAFRKVSMTIYVINDKEGYFEKDNVKYYGINGIDMMVEEITSNLMSVGSIPGSGGLTNCDRKVDRPFIYPFINFNIRTVGSLEYDSQYGAWSRTITVEGDYGHEL